MRKFTEQSTIGQFSSILGLLAVMTTLFGAVVLLAADSVIDRKYATDTDVQSMQKEFAHQVGKLSDTVNANTAVVQKTSTSVQSLALTIITIQIRDLEPTIRDLLREKASQGIQWSSASETTLRDIQRDLSDLQFQRRILFESITGDIAQ